LTRLLSAAYGRITALRRAWYARPDRHRRLAHPVISVGNLSMGGSGKTPVVVALARLLLQRGERPAILTRGYARRDTTEGVLVVSDGERVLQPVERSGDEPQLLAQTLPDVPVLVSADRYLAGAFAERHFGVTVSILDDGFQHVRLARDVDLLLVSPGDLDDCVVPAGHLREPLGAARFADALLVTGSDEDVAAVGTALRHSKVFRVVHKYGAPVWRWGSDPVHGSTQHLESIRERGLTPHRVIAFAGIARPERFFDALRTLGYEVVRELSFRDHHWYSASDLQAIQAAAREANAMIVTTEKDAVRCELDCAVLPMTVEIEPRAEFEQWLIATLVKANDRSPKGRSSE
jgi:tetraacyldisaccharide 4'-kinase